MSVLETFILKETSFSLYSGVPPQNGEFKNRLALNTTGPEIPRWVKSMGQVCSYTFFPFTESSPLAMSEEPESVERSFSVSNPTNAGANALKGRSKS